MLGRFILLLGLLFSTLAFAEPRQWDADGIPVRAVSAIIDFSSVSRTDGATLLVWAQSRGGEQIVLGQLLSPNGDALWDAGGRMVAQGDHKAAAPHAVAVEGGWVICWMDQEQIASDGPATGQYGIGTLRAIKIDDNGAPIWASGLAGIEVVPRQTEWMLTSFTVHASGGGAIVTWSIMDHWAVKVSATGQLEWPESVRLNMRLATNQLNVASDFAGGLVFAWYQIINGDTILYANKLLQNGSFAWNDTAGVELKRDNVRFREIGVCGDGNGGMFVTWVRSNQEAQAYAQHLNAQGVASWANGGAPFIDLAENNRLRSVAQSYNNGTLDGVMAVYYRYQSDSASLVAQKINLAGTQAWGVAGNTVCVSETTSEDFGKATITSDRAGGLICNYKRYEYSGLYNEENRVVRIASDQTRPWGDDCGVAVNVVTDAYTVSSPPVLFDNSVRVFWLENLYRNSSLRAQRLNFVTGALQYATPHEFATGAEANCSSIEIVKLNGGATAIAWRTEANGKRELWFQIQDAFGIPMFETEGRLLAVDENGESVDVNGFGMTQDGSGGFFAAYGAYTPGWYVPRIVHLDGQGNFISPRQGVLLEFPGTVEVIQDQIKLLADGSGGCFFTASLYASETYYLNNATMRVNSVCQPIWSQAVIKEVIDEDITTVDIMPSDNGSVLVAYKSGIYPQAFLNLMRIASGGAVVWDDSVTTPNINYSSDFAVCPNNLGGAYFVWETLDDTGDTSRAFAQQINVTGQSIWSDHGIEFLAVAGWLEDFSCAADRVGNLTVAWSMHSDNDADIFAQRFNSAGNTLWGQTGIVLCAAQDYQYQPKVFALSDNEVYVLWQDDRNRTQEQWAADIYGTHLDARGRIGGDSYWQADGSPICNFDYIQYEMAATADGAGGVTLAWLDSRTAFIWEFSVFAQRLYDPIFTDAEEKPELVTEFLLSQNYPNPFNPETVIEFALPMAGQTTLTIFDVTGREVAALIDKSLAAGHHRVNFDGSRLASGVYFYSLKAGEQSVTRKMVLLK